MWVAMPHVSNMQKYRQQNPRAPKPASPKRSKLEAIRCVKMFYICDALPFFAAECPFAFFVEPLLSFLYYGFWCVWRVAGDIAYSTNSTYCIPISTTSRTKATAQPPRACPCDTPDARPLHEALDQHQHKNMHTISKRFKINKNLPHRHQPPTTPHSTANT